MSSISSCFDTDILCFVRNLCFVQLFEFVRHIAVHNIHLLGNIFHVCTYCLFLVYILFICNFSPLLRDLGIFRSWSFVPDFILLQFG